MIKQVQTIKGKPNPYYLTPLQRALEGRLTSEEALDVWGHMTMHEKRQNADAMFRKIERSMESEDRGLAEKLAVLHALLESDLLDYSEIPRQRVEIDARMLEKQIEDYVENNPDYEAKQ